MESEYDFWVLDLDGTVVDVETSYINEVCTEVGERLGVSFTTRESKLLWYGYDDGRERVLSSLGVGREEFWDVFHEVEQPRERAAATHLYPDAERFLDRAESPVGLVTHCQEYLTGPVLDALDIAEAFETVVCCTDETGWKPDPRPVELAMQEMNVAHNGHAGALVGDDPQDMGAAHNAGLAPYRVRRHDVSTDGPHDARQVGALTDIVE
jgi:phosphoglycolate phosphatase